MGRESEIMRCQTSKVLRQHMPISYFANNIPTKVSYSYPSPTYFTGIIHFSPECRLQHEKSLPNFLHKFISYFTNNEQMCPYINFGTFYCTNELITKVIMCFPKKNHIGALNKFFYILPRPPVKYLF